MKRTILLLSTLLLSIGVAFAQNPFYSPQSSGPRTVGVRIAPGIYDFVYQYSFKDAQFLETGMGVVGESINLCASYDFVILRPDWTKKGEWRMYIGPGLALGADNDQLNFGVIASVGLEYSFDKMPVAMSFDLRPEYELVHRFNFVPQSWIPALGVRYCF